MRNIIRQLIPSFLLEKYRQYKKAKKNQFLQKQKESGIKITKNDLIHQFKSIGIQEGDTLLVHASLSKIGFIENGAKDVVEALIDVIGSEGNILMPNSPNASFQLDYIKELEQFDVLNDKSKLGSISEYFRLLPTSKRSAHPTEPVSCVGPDKEYFVGDHFGNNTPYNKNSPYYRISEKGGKILYLGVTFDNAGTNLHTLEDAIENFKYPVYYSEEFTVKVKFEDGSINTMTTKVHNPEQSKKRKCDGLIPLFESKGVLKKVKVGNADSLLVDAKLLLSTMIEEYENNGVTMYTPTGN